MSERVLAMVIIVVIKHYYQKELGEERADLAYTSVSVLIIERNQAGS